MLVRVVVLGTLGAILAPAQRMDLRPPEAKNIDVVVRDERGEPISEATISHTGDRFGARKTDGAGRLGFSTRSPAFVIRKPGYKSFFVKVNDDAKIEATLYSASRPFPICSDGQSLG